MKWRKKPKKGQPKVGSLAKRPYRPSPMALLPTPGTARQIPVTVHLPLAYLRILNTEAELLGLRRNGFVAMLLRRKLGMVNLERTDGAPEYDVTDEELEETKVYLWHVEPGLRELVDADRKQMGLTSYAAWINALLNDWIGRPGGVRRPRRGGHE
jgi:hypothetical protein